MTSGMPLLPSSRFGRSVLLEATCGVELPDDEDEDDRRLLPLLLLCRYDSIDVGALRFVLSSAARKSVGGLLHLSNLLWEEVEARELLGGSA